MQCVAIETDGSKWPAVGPARFDWWTAAGSGSGKGVEWEPSKYQFGSGVRTDDMPPGDSF